MQRNVFVFLCVIAVAIAQAVPLVSDGFDTTAKGLWFVKLYAPWCGHCKSLAPTWDALSKRVEGTNVKVGKINCDENSALCGRYNIQGYPTLLLLKDGDLIAEYEGPRSVDSFVSFLNEATAEKKSEGHVVELNSHNFDLATGNPTTRWMIKFFAPWCGHCKSLEPTWEKLAKEVANTDLFIARVDCTQENDLCERFGIRGFPTLYHLAGPKMTKFEGPRSFDGLLSFAQGGHKDRTAVDRPKAYTPSLFASLMNNPIYLVLILVTVFITLLVGVALCICFCDLGDTPMPPKRVAKPSALSSDSEPTSEEPSEPVSPKSDDESSLVKRKTKPRKED